ncbi:NUDIX hydrolase [Pengzhenrongella frigida]|uniref:NUDIX domain-containing protein n=1 Tax=Pengzhenrongella frigida TaxID=1259133 RepID=A0A4Q5N6W9_9MICO|nr:NUDIX domain-containing protein [Cellulomonas sp. HLT2-17]RYV52101.1 NUDIX domain-containing protein [Cellulomonas sp. HLT2-17]
MTRFQVVPAAYVVFRRAGTSGEQVLLQLRQNTGYRDGFWASGAAGHVEAGESVLAAARRESREELGVTVEIADLRPPCAMHRTAGPGWIDARVDFFFECRRWTGEPRRLEPDKAADLRWFDLAALPEPVVPHELVVLESLTSGGVAPVVTFGF